MHISALGFSASPETVVARPTYSRGPAEPVHDCARFGRLLDLIIESVPPLLATGRGGALKRRNAFFKKCVSIACWPILRSSSEIRSASSLVWGCAPLPGNACSPFARHSLLQVSNRLGLS